MTANTQLQMGDKVLVQQRCLAVQLLHDVALPRHLHLASPSSSSSDDTPTPTNSPSGPAQIHTYNPPSDLQDGYLLFLAWRAANIACVWDRELVRAAETVEYLGHLVGGVVLVGGPVAALATLTHAWSRALLIAPPGYTLTTLGEVRGWGVVKVPQGQFTPLSDALCWVVHHLTREGGRAESEAVQVALTAAFPTLTIPDSAHIHATLSTLIRQCKVYYSGSSYGIVQPDTYYPRFTAPLDPVSATDASSPVRDAIPALKGSVHAAAQTDLAELITGHALPSDAIITPTFPGRGREGRGWWSPKGGSHPHTARTASLRLSPARASALTTALASTMPTSNTYTATDHSDDITVRGERGSMLSKLLLLPVPGRRRLATCSAQFPPPEWSDPACHTRHLHSVSTQTATLTHQVPSASWTYQQWTPRSATLPRRLRPPKSATPSPPRRPSQSATPPPHSHRNLDQPPSAGRNLCHLHPSIHNKHHSPNRHKKETHRNEAHNNNSYKNDSHKSQKPNYHTNDGRTSPLYHNLEYHRHHTEAPTSREPSSRDKLREITVGERKEDREQQHHTGRPTWKQELEKTTDSSKVMEQQAMHRKQNKSRKHNCNKHQKNNKGPRAAVVEGAKQPVHQDESKLLKTKEVISLSNEVAVSEGKDECEGLDRGQEKLYNRSTLHLPLGSGIKPVSGSRQGKGQRQEQEQEQETAQHMNNCRKVAWSPQQRPHGLTTNLLHITKGSISDLTSRNLGYQEVDKCHKKPCSQTLDQAHLRQSPDTSPDSNIDVIVSGEGKSSPDEGWEGENKIGAEERISQDKEWQGGVKLGREGTMSPEAVSVTTYPSLTDLNLTFTSLAAQKILAGGSVNSLDTLAEVNLAAKKRNQTPVTNTDFGFL